MSDKTLNLTPDLYQYLLQHSLHETEILKQLRAETAKLPMSSMQISPEQGQFMALLVTLLNAKKTIDIGTFTGYSALVVALALPVDGKVIACDMNDDTTDIAKRFWQQAGVENKINLYLAPARDTLQALLDQGEAGTFDFVFIDADKENYVNYYELSLQLLRTGGLIAVDNVLWGGSVVDEQITDASTQAIRAINKIIHADKRVMMCMLPIGDGLTLARKN